VYSDLFDPAFEQDIGHIELARWPDAILVAPATANFLARVAHGMCDDLLSTILCATTAPVVLAPAMNTQMFQNHAVQRNLADLAARPGYTVVPPDSGELVCKEVGAGRLPDPPVLLAALRAAMATGPLTGRTVVVTAGPTQEALDPVRFLSNHSSGKMGFAFASAAARRGADVTLIAGPVSLPTPPGVTRVDVTTAAQMHRAVMDRAEDADLIIKAAAVADWRPKNLATEKKKKAHADLQVEFERTVDILAQLGTMPDATRPTLVGFAAETEDVETYALGKLNRKNLDFIVANRVGGDDCTFGADDAAVTVLSRNGGRHTVGLRAKRDIADAVLDLVIEALNS
jgi:phosphopantothenoylcysteine decarboxylase/phosphopantothenate--cysteine ligase